MLCLHKMLKGRSPRKELYLKPGLLANRYRWQTPGVAVTDSLFELFVVVLQRFPVWPWVITL